VLKINQNEAAALLGRPLHGPEDVRLALPALRTHGAQQVVITLGAAGAMAIDATGKVYFCGAPQVDAICAVGSGDSFFAGLAAALCAGAALQIALRHGVAAGAANTLQLGAGSFSAGRMQQLLAALPQAA
jgi:fructose-1-phosphate kinase PfkB-like protein